MASFVGFGDYTAGGLSTANDATSGAYPGLLTGSDFERAGAAYDKLLMMRIKNGTKINKYGTKKTVPVNSGVTKAWAYRYKNLAPATTPLTEGILPAGTKPERTKVEWGVKQYGDFIPYSDQFDLFDVRNVKSDFLDLLGDQAAETEEIVNRDTIYGGTRVIYAGAETGILGVADNATVVTQANLKQLQLLLKGARAKTQASYIAANDSVGTNGIDDGYIVYTPMQVTEELTAIAGFTKVQDYPSRKQIMDPDEIGAFGKLRFVEVDLPKVKTGQGTTTDKNVYCLLAFGQDAYATVSVDGKKGAETIVKSLSSGGVDNALNQVGSFGWKAYFGAAILNDRFMIRVETSVSAAYDIAEDATNWGAEYSA